MPFRQAWEQTGRGVDWVIRGHFVVQVLVGLGIGKIVQWLVMKYALVSPPIATAVWLLTTAGVLWLLLAVFRNKVVVQQTAIQIVAAGGVEENVKAVTNFYKTSGGPFLDEMEAHFQRLAAHHKDIAERERFLVRALSAGAISYLHDMTYSSIFRSQIEVLDNLNTRGAVTLDTLRPNYDAVASVSPNVYRLHPFESWIEFMKGQNLIRQDGNVVQITVRGKDFLKYLVQFGKSAKDRLY